MTPQLINQLNLAAEQFLQVKREVLKDWRSSCQCLNPGNDAKCSTCPSFRALVRQMQEVLASGSGETLPGLHVPELNPPYSEQVQQECIGLFAAGYTLQQIQQLTGVTSLRIMRQWFRGAGLEKKGSEYSAEVRTACLQLHRDGVSRKQIQEQTGVSADIISDWLKQAGIRKPKKTYSDTERQNCINLYLQGNSCKTVEALTGVPKSMVQRWVKESGIQRNRLYRGGHPRLYSIEFRQSCLDLLQQGVTAAQIEERMNVNADTVRQWRREALNQKDADCQISSSEG